MYLCFFVSDLHGKIPRYEALFENILKDKPAAVFIGGDLLPFNLTRSIPSDSALPDFINDYLAEKLQKLRFELGANYPRIFIIMGNDDVRSEESKIIDLSAKGLWEYVHDQRAKLGKWLVYGYSYVPPTPFRLKDWERYDVSRYVDPGCIPPEMGIYTIPAKEHEIKYATIKKDLDMLAGDDDLENAIFLFHSPPHKTKLDRAALDGQFVDGVPLDPHVGSIAIRSFIESRQPLLSLHGHIHESARLMESWRDRIGRTYMFNAAHDGKELALIKFDLDNPENAERKLI